MSNLKYQKKIVSRIKKVGVSRVKINSQRNKDAEEAITASDIKRLIGSDIITVKPKKGNSTFRIKKVKAQKKKGRRRGHGSIKGKRNARTSSKTVWIKTARLLRKEAKTLRDDGVITTLVYRNVYGKIKGGFFRSRKHMAIYLERNELLQKTPKKVIKNEESKKKN